MSVIAGIDMRIKTADGRILRVKQSDKENLDRAVLLWKQGLRLEELAREAKNEFDRQALLKAGFEFSNDGRRIAVLLPYELHTIWSEQIEVTEPLYSTEPGPSGGDQVGTN